MGLLLDDGGLHPHGVGAVTAGLVVGGAAKLQRVTKTNQGIIPHTAQKQVTNTN